VSDVEVSRWEDVRAKRTDLTEADREWARSVLAAAPANRLFDARQRQARTEIEVAEQMGVSPDEVSELEHDDLELAEVSTLRSYVEALGARLQVIVEFEDGERLQVA